MDTWLTEGTDVASFTYNCTYGRFWAVKEYLESIDDIKKRELLELHNKNDFGKTPLIYACDNGYENIVRCLLNSGANIEACDSNEMTPLMHACRHGRLGIVRLLVERRANIFARDKGLMTPFLHASATSSMHIDIIKLLIEHGANVNDSDEFGCTPIIYASQIGIPKIIEFLIENGAEADAKCDCGDTALFVAIKNGKTAIIPMLAGIAIPSSKMQYADIALSMLVPRRQNFSAWRYEACVKSMVPLLFDRAVKDPVFAMDAERDATEILGGKTARDRKPLTKKDVALVKKILKMLRSIDHTEKRFDDPVSVELNNDASHEAYDMEL